MRFEGRILGKAGVNKMETAYTVYNILIDMGYSMRFSFNKYEYSISYMKEENDILFFNDAEHMIEVYNYERNLEIPTERANELGLETYYRFSNIFGKELIILELLHRYLQENPNDIFYVDNGRYYNKAMIDSIYNAEPDKNWIYKPLYSIKSIAEYINICVSTTISYMGGMGNIMDTRHRGEMSVELRYEGRIIRKRKNSKLGTAQSVIRTLKEAHCKNIINIRRESYNIVYANCNNDRVIEIYCNTQMTDIPTDEIKQMGFETYFRITDLIGKEMQVLEIIHKYLKKFPEDIFYIDNGCFFTKSQIDEIFDNENKNEKWIFKNRKG